MTSFQQMTRISRFGLFGLVAGLAFMVSACSSGNGQSVTDESRPMGYVIGESIVDSTIAAIIFSEFGADTLWATEFTGRVESSTQHFPQGILEAEHMEHFRRSVLEDFVIQHVFYGEMDQRQITVSDDEVAAEINRWRANFGDDEDAFQQALAAEGLTIDTLQSIASDMLRRRQFVEVLSHVDEPTRAEQRAFRDHRAEEVQVEHILLQVPPDSDAAAEEEVRLKAVAVLDSLKKGSDFNEMAIRHSADPGSASRGGLLPFIARGQTVPEFEEAAFGLKKAGEMTSRPVKTDFGYHIIRFVDRRMNPMEDDEIVELMTQERRQEALNKAVDGLRAKATVRINPAVVNADLSTRFEGF
jgi:peptidyl-prolyl cis-trans isomerase C